MPVFMSSGDSVTALTGIMPGEKLLDILKKHNLLEEEVIVIDLDRERLVMGNERYGENSNWKILIVVSRG